MLSFSFEWFLLKQTSHLQFYNSVKASSLHMYVFSEMHCIFKVIIVLVTIKVYAVTNVITLRIITHIAEKELAFGRNSV